MGLKINRQTDLTELFDQFAIDPLTKEKQVKQPQENKDDKTKQTKETKK
ncbi:SPJ_0845 family protein [Ligilactobacillus sp. Marseille-Q7487]|jgi:hypothetical protein|nr:SPJ_0845 family protein [Ligilactobacillus sp. Marseille-Q7487]